MEERARRIIDNEVRFRDAMERIEGVRDTLTRVHTMFDAVCECGRPGCATSITISLPAYAAAHSDPAEFIVVPGHRDAAVEDVVASGATYVIARRKRLDD